MCVRVCVCVCVCVSVFVCVGLHTCMCVFVCLCLRVRVFTKHDDARLLVWGLFNVFYFFIVDINNSKAMSTGLVR